MNIIFTPGKIHPNIATTAFSLREANRLAVKTKLLTSTYILQCNRASFNQNAVDPTCQLCLKDKEDITHFLLHCDKLKITRINVMQDIHKKYRRITSQNFDSLSDSTKIKVILDCTHIQKVELEKLQRFEYHCRRFMYQLHTERYRALSEVKPGRANLRLRVKGRKGRV